jgi:hypothetical protein
VVEVVETIMVGTDSLAGLGVADLVILVHIQEELEIVHQHHLHKEIRVVLDLARALLARAAVVAVLVDPDLEVDQDQVVLLLVV